MSLLPTHRTTTTAEPTGSIIELGLDIAPVAEILLAAFHSNPSQLLNSIGAYYQITTRLPSIPREPVLDEEIQRKLRREAWERAEARVAAAREYREQMRDERDEAEAYARVVLNLATGRHVHPRLKAALPRYCEETGWTDDGLVLYYLPAEYGRYKEAIKEPAPYLLEILTVRELREVAVLAEVTGASRMKKAEIVDAIMSSGYDYYGDIVRIALGREADKLYDSGKVDDYYIALQMAREALAVQYPELDWDRRS